MLSFLQREETKEVNCVYIKYKYVCECKKKSLTQAFRLLMIAEFSSQMEWVAEVYP